MTKEPFGSTAGKNVSLYRLKNARGTEVAATNFGATLVSLKTPDSRGNFADLVLGYDELSGYVADSFFFGGTIGRYANRIAHGRFVLNGAMYSLPLNNGENHLHGGPKGFYKVVWEAADASTPDTPAVRFNYCSRDGEEGYPGNLSVQVTYALNAANELNIEYEASTDKPTVINLTNHGYFNLAGEGHGDILAHRLVIHASRFTPVNQALIPTGELRATAGTPVDFSAPVEIGARIQADDEQIRLARGYDHNFVVDRDGPGLAHAAHVHEPASGRVMDVYTTEPGIQFYSGNFLDGSMRGKGGKTYPFRCGFCLETQHFPDSPNQPSFPSTELKPGQLFRSRTVYRFGTVRS